MTLKFVAATALSLAALTAASVATAQQGDADTDMSGAGAQPAASGLEEMFEAGDLAQIAQGATDEELLRAIEAAAGEGRDTYATEESREVVASGVIERQQQISEALLLLERQKAFAEAIADVAVVLGPDAEIEVGPGRFQSLEGTPAGLRAEIEMERLRQELAELRGGMPTGDETVNADGPVTTEDLEAFRERIEEDLLTGTGVAPLNGALDQPIGQPQNVQNGSEPANGDAADGIRLSEQGTCHDDASPWYARLGDFISYATMADCLADGGIAYGGYRDPADAAQSAADVEAETDQIPSLVEIFGTGEALVAIVEFGQTRVRMREGDTHMGFQAVEVGTRSLSLKRGDQTIRDEIIN